MALSLFRRRSLVIIRAHVRVEVGVRCDEEVRFHLPLHLIRDPKNPNPEAFYENFLGLRNAISLVVAFHDTLRCGILLGVLRFAGPFPRPSQLASRPMSVRVECSLAQPQILPLIPSVPLIFSSHPIFTPHSSSRIWLDITNPSTSECPQPHLKSFHFSRDIQRSFIQTLPSKRDAPSSLLRPELHLPQPFFVQTSPAETINRGR